MTLACVEHVMSFVADDPQVYGDCANVINEARRPVLERLNGRSAYAGVMRSAWCEPGLRHIDAFIKVKADADTCNSTLTSKLNQAEAEYF